MTSCNTYKDEFISRFVDNEVSTRDHEDFVHHMAVCPACKNKVSRFGQMASAFERHAAAQALSIKVPLVPISLETEKGKRRQADGQPKGMILKLASLGTAALIFAVALLPWTGGPNLDQLPEPSAIVNSVDTYGSSVMIIETANTQHTIIWFSET